jgi:hypothetical protein
MWLQVATTYKRGGYMKTVEKFTDAFSPNVAKGMWGTQESLPLSLMKTPLYGQACAIPICSVLNWQ